MQKMDYPDLRRMVLQLSFWLYGGDMDSINFLHISDFHVGLKGTSDVWPQIREQFQADLRRHSRENGAIDLVIFSGDLTQAGTSDEFEQASNELRRLWDFFGSIDQNPSLFIVPGNHDLVRPKDDSAILLAVENVRKRPKIFDALISDENSDYRKELKLAFASYTNFLNEIQKHGIQLARDHVGVFPGDCSFVLEGTDYRIGFLGLNSAWSQLEGGDFTSRIEISTKQITNSIPEDVSDWLARNHFNFIVTHHPKDWFNRESLEDFENEINPFGRFDGHFCGHMHEIVNTSVGMGGSLRSRTFQAASLFGLEKEGDGKTNRRHGYSLFKLNLQDESMTSWPRKATRINSGGWRINSDDRAIEETGASSNVESFPIRKSFIAPKKKT